MNSRRAPAHIVSGHGADELTNFSGDPRSTVAAPSRLPGPIQSKSLSVPSDQCIRLENYKCLETAGPDTVEPDPEEALTPSKPDPFALPVVQDRQLLAESEDFEVQNCPATDQDCECCEQRQ